MKIKIPVLIIVFTIGFAMSLLAREKAINLVLFRGEIQLINQSGQKFPARIGQLVDVDQLPVIYLGNNASVFLKQGQRLVQLNTTGEYALQTVFKTASPGLSNAISFLKQLSEPRVYTAGTLARGEKTGAPLDDANYFEALWERIVLESEEQVSVVPAESLLAAAAWFQQHHRRARVAFILERLNGIDGGENEFYRQLRMESLRGIRLVEINRELHNTRQAIAASANTLRYKALLIGIDQYHHPAWQELKNPISDIRAIGQILINNYHFDPADVTLLENATYDEIIEAFNQLKQFAGEDTSLLVYYAGHGFYPRDEGEGYWIPRDAGEPESLRLFLPTSTVLGKINSIKTRHTLLIADSCFSGSLIRKTRSSENNSRFYRELSQKKSRQIITSGGLEPVDDQGAGNHSMFAGKLISILSQDQQEPLSASELAFYLRKEVKNAWGNQTPEYGRLQIQDDENGEFFFVQLADRAEPAIEQPLLVEKRTLKKPTSGLRNYAYDNLPGGVCLAPKPFTDLRNCKFRGKNIKNISMEGANLEGVDFSYINLQEVNLKGANLKNTDWRYSSIDELHAEETIAENSDWRYTNINDSDFSHSNLKNTDFRYSDLEDVKLDFADMTGADIRYISMDDVSMEGTNLTDVNSNDDELFGARIEGIVAGIQGTIEGIRERQANSETESLETGPTSMDNRSESFLLLGIKPFSHSLPEQELRPFNIGVYLGNNLLLGGEFGSVSSTNSDATSKSKARLAVRGAFIRLFTESTFNVLFGINQLSWEGESTATNPANSSQSMTVTTTDVATIATLGVGNQWLLDSGITIGVDWALLSGKVTSNNSTREVKDRGGTSTETSKADSELSDLEDELWKEELFSNRSHYLTLTLGYSF